MCGLDPSCLHSEHIARLLSKEQRKKAGVQTATEAADKQRVKSERELQEQICSFLALRGVNWIIRSRMDRKTTNAKGTPDLIMSYRGRPIAIEVKIPGASLSDNQQAAGIYMLKDGWDWMVVTCLEQVKAKFDQLDDPTP